MPTSPHFTIQRVNSAFGLRAVAKGGVPKQEVVGASAFTAAHTFHRQWTGLMLGLDGRDNDLDEDDPCGERKAEAEDMTLQAPSPPAVNRWASNEELGSTFIGGARETVRERASAPAAEPEFSSSASDLIAPSTATLSRLPLCPSGGPLSEVLRGGDGGPAGAVPSSYSDPSRFSAPSFYSAVSTSTSSEVMLEGSVSPMSSCGEDEGDVPVTGSWEVDRALTPLDGGAGYVEGDGSLEAMNIGGDAMELDEVQGIQQGDGDDSTGQQRGGAAGAEVSFNSHYYEVHGVIPTVGGQPAELRNLGPTAVMSLPAGGGRTAGHNPFERFKISVQRLSK